MRSFGSLLRSAFRAFLAPAEDPRGAAPESLGRLGSLLTQVREARVATESARRNLEAAGAQLQASRDVMEAHARRALRAGRQDLAQEAIERRQAADRERVTVDAQVEAARLEEGRLALVERQLVARIESLSTRHAALRARYDAAQAQVHLSEALAGISADLQDLRAALERTEREAEHMENRARAIDQLAQSGALGVDALRGGAALDRSAAPRASQPAGQRARRPRTGEADL